VNVVVGLAGSLALLSIIYALFILAALSQRIGQVRKMPPLYRGFYFGAAALAVAFFGRLLRVSALLAAPEQPTFLNSDLFYLVVYYLPLSVGLTVSLAITWRYWSWLLREQV
jgi:hypothetical protein